MLVGSLDVDELMSTAPTIAQYCDESINLDNVTVLQLTAEMKNSAREAVLPPSLHPTVPAALSIQAWQVPDSRWGAFQMLVNRVYCRSGVRARGFTTKVITSTADSASGLASTLGFPTITGDVRFRDGYDGADVEVNVEGQKVFQASAVEPEPMGLGDVQYTSTLNAAHTPNGFRLVQVEATHVANRVDRVNATISEFDGATLGNALLHPHLVVSASLVQGAVSWPAVRFVCKVGELAFTGTEPILTEA